VRAGGRPDPIEITGGIAHSNLSGPRLVQVLRSKLTREG